MHAHLYLTTTLLVHTSHLYRLSMYYSEICLSNTDTCTFSCGGGCGSLSGEPSIDSRSIGIHVCFCGMNNQIMYIIIHVHV